MDQKSRDNDTRPAFDIHMEAGLWAAGSRISTRIPSEAVAFYAAMLVITRGLRSMKVAEVLWNTGDMHYRDMYPYLLTIAATTHPRPHTPTHTHAKTRGPGQ